jgi:hypothetical protein
VTPDPQDVLGTVEAEVEPLGEVAVVQTVVVFFFMQARP